MGSMYKKYLGGHEWVTHTDEGALKVIMDRAKIETMYDIGCGPGGQVRLARDLGIDAQGIDGDPRVAQEAKDIKIHTVDYTKETFVPDEYDLAWSTEFVEHVEAQYIHYFMYTFARSKFVIMTHAPPGTSGNHHVNCQGWPYWINVFTDYGLAYDPTLTKLIRQHSTMERNFMRENGLFFVNVNRGKYGNEEKDSKHAS